jgi:mannose-1-phosphate guanylyltransferase
MYALLMAGGGGTRLWPVSTDERPKQFQAFFDNRSLLRTTYERILPIIPPDQIWLDRE